MPLAAGDKLGPYEILAPVGKGGMGEVWKARDTRLDRIVAIKVSQEHFSERFEREAKAIAALNHSNICTLYDVGPNYLVMEYIEGTPLKGPLPVDQALKCAVQICDALDAAHKKGITHRDLKPGNILVTKAGVKLLDFGLAKQIEADATVTMAVMGTPAYMAPEQWQGKPGDTRSDIYAFGCVLHEMLTGKRAAAERTAIEPAALESILRTCLAQDPDDRWQSARDLRSSLQLVGQASNASIAVQPARSGLRQSVPQSIPWIIAAALALTTALALWSPWRSTPIALQQPTVRVDIDLGAPVADSTIGPDTILSPDGTRLVFVSKDANGTPHLSTRRMDQPNPTELPGTEGAYSPFFSPDGQGLGFFAGGKLKKTRIDGGVPSVLCDAPAGRGATWLEDGSIVASLDTRRGLSLVPAGGGQPTVLTEIESGELNHRSPRALPGSKAVLFSIGRVVSNYEFADIGVVSLPERRRKILLERAGMSPTYLPSGHLAYVSKGSLFVAPFDAERLELHGPGKLLIEDVAENTSVGIARFSVSQTGAMLYRAGRGESLREVQWLSSDGSTQPLWPEPAISVCPRLSPDGRRLAIFIANGPDVDLWVYDIENNAKARLTSGLAGAYPVWSADGQYILFSTTGGIYWTRSDGAGRPQPLISSKFPAIGTSFAGDGRRLAYQELLPGGGNAIKAVLVENASGQLHAGAPEVFLQTTASSNSFPAFSQDGHWLAYADGESGVYEIFVRAFPDRGTKVQVSNSGGYFPEWSPNGHELFYRTSDNHIMVVNYSIRDGAFSADKPRLWSQRPLFDLGITANFDLAPDGKRFAVLMRPGGEQPRSMQSHVTLLLNFLDQLRK